MPRRQNNASMTNIQNSDIDNNVQNGQHANGQKARVSKKINDNTFSNTPLKMNALKAYYKTLTKYDQNYALWQNLRQFEPLKSNSAPPVDIDNSFSEKNPTRADFARLKKSNQELFEVLHTTASTQAMQNRLFSAIDVSMLKNPSVHAKSKNNDCLNSKQISNLIADLHDSHGLTAILQLQIMKHFLQHVESMETENAGNPEFQEWKFKALRDCWRVMHQRNFDKDTMHIFTSMADVLRNSIQLTTD